jgi:anthranilate phosphoribosyltransferase
MIKETISKVVDGENLSADEAYRVMTEIMQGQATDAQIAAFITAFRLKGETVDEITGCTRAMREKATKINTSSENVVDTCGTGGDGKHTFNISTAAAIVSAAAGAVVAKHGNRSVSSKCGSADVLKELGVNIEIDKEKVEQCIDEIGIGFLFAPLMHKAMKYAIGPRREVGIRTVFNILGPLTNPAGARAQLLGVYDGALTEIMAGVLKNLGSKHVFIVHGEDGLDEISISSATKVSELKDGEIKTYKIQPEDYDIPLADLESILGGGPEENARIIREIFDGAPGPRRDIVVLNSAAVITAADITGSLEDGMTLAAQIIDNGKAKEKLQQLIDFTQKA